MNFQQSISKALEWSWMSSVWIRLLPGVVEVGIWLLFVQSVFRWPLPEWLPYGDEAGVFLVLLGVCLMLWVIAIRQRLHPVMGRLFGAFAILVSVSIVMEALRQAVSTRNTPHSGRSGATLDELLIKLVFVVVCTGLILMAGLRGLRKRQQAVPGLVKLLTSGGKNARRKAIFVLGELEALDRGVAKAAREEGVTGWRWLRRLRQWVGKSDTPSTMADAVPAVQRALRDDDLFVRTQTAKLLTKMGVTFRGEETKLVE